VSNSPGRSDGEGMRESIALALMWHRLFPPETIEPLVAKVALPAGARAAFMTQYRAIPARLEPLMEPGARKIRVDLAIEVYQRRQKHYRDYADFYRKLDHLVAAGDKSGEAAPDRDRLVRAFEKLRSEFLARCGAADCRVHPIHGQITLQLAKLHVLRGDLLAASAESTLISRRGTWMAGLSQAIYVEQYKEVSRLGAVREKYDRAIRSGMDEKAAAEMAGGTPVSVGGLIEPRTEVPRVTQALDGWNKVRQEQGIVASTSGGGEEKTVLFKKERHENTVPYDCRRTNRISSISSDGIINYEEDCKWRDTVDYVETHPPIKIPAGEGGGLRGGDTITFVSLDGSARILEVKRGEKTVQIRADRVK
jgi:hypothetical protein